MPPRTLDLEVPQQMMMMMMRRESMLLAQWHAEQVARGKGGGCPSRGGAAAYPPAVCDLAWRDPPAACEPGWCDWREAAPPALCPSSAKNKCVSRGSVRRCHGLVEGAPWRSPWRGSVGGPFAGACSAAAGGERRAAKELSSMASSEPLKRCSCARADAAKAAPQPPLHAPSTTCWRERGEAAVVGKGGIGTAYLAHGLADVIIPTPATAAAAGAMPVPAPTAPSPVPEADSASAGAHVPARVAGGAPGMQPGGAGSQSQAGQGPHHVCKLLRQGERAGKAMRWGCVIAGGLIPDNAMSLIG
eukprot:1157456-Pelagomonas_calceolata.AAC.7